jgi:threonine/homoserine/homoserine lactone efflux protein
MLYNGAIMELLGVFIFSAVMGFGAVASPGPVSTAIVSQAPRQGWVVGPLVASGHALMELALAALVAFGLASWLDHPTAHFVVALLGGLLLIWMGLSMLLGAWRDEIKLPGMASDSQQMTRRQVVGLGVVTTLSNPFWYAWWVTVAAGYLMQFRQLGVAAVGAFYLGHVSVDFAWDTFLSTVVGGGKKWITDRVYRGIIALCGVFFIYLGVTFLLQVM